MAKSTGIVLAAGGISFANEWWQTKTPNFRIPAATLGAALFLASPASDFVSGHTLFVDGGWHAAG